MLEEWFTQLHTNIIIFHLKGLKTLKLVWLKLHHFPKHLLNCDFVDSQSYGRTFHGFVRIPDAEISCFPFVRSTACLVKTRTSFEKFAKDLVNCATRCSNVTVIKLFKWRWTTIGKPEKLSYPAEILQRQLANHGQMNDILTKQQRCQTLMIRETKKKEKKVYSNFLTTCKFLLWVNKVCGFLVLLNKVL